MAVIHFYLSPQMRFAMLRSDCCAFGMPREGNVAKWVENEYNCADSLILLHVGDILRIGATFCKARFPGAIQEYGHGGVGYLALFQPIAYCGMEIPQSHGRAISLPLNKIFIEDWPVFIPPLLLRAVD